MVKKILLTPILILRIGKIKQFNYLKIVLLLFLTVSFNGVSQTLDIPVTTTFDDVEESVSTGAIDETSTDLELCTEASDQFVGIRFQNVTIPKGSTITNAYIQFQVDEVNSNSVTLNIIGIDVDNSPIFTNTDHDVSDRIDGDISFGTTATVSWAPSNWPTVGAQGVNQRTSNVSTIVKEIVDRVGWNSGNAMAFVFSKLSGSGTRVAESYNGTSVPILHVEFIAPPAPEIDILGNGITIVDGDLTPNNLDHTYFESTAIGSTITKTYTIQNTGNQPLNVTSIASSDPKFTVSTAGPFTIAASSSQTFNVTYLATTIGRSTSVITVLSNDTDEATYNFNVLGEISTPQTFIQDGHWKYLDDGSDQGTAWRTGDVSTWASGDAELGYGDGDEITVVGYGVDANNKYPTTYFRKKITVSAIDVLQSTLRLRALRDDGMVVYINGTQVWSSNMPGTFDYLTYASGNATENTWVENSIPNPFSTPGTYEIAVEIHQVNATSSDISFNFELELQNYVLTSGGLWYYLDDNTNQDATNWKTNTTILDGGVDDWASGNAQLGFGDGDEITTVADNNQITTYFRKQINVSATDAANSTLIIEALRDDGIVIYVNGTEVLRNNMPTGSITHNTTAFGEVTNLATDRNFEDFWNVFKVDNTLVTGINQIAVEIHQYATPIQDDLSFDLELYTNNDYSVVPTIKPDRDLDGVEDYLDADDDNDALPDIVEGCYTTNPESLNTGGENSILSGLGTAPYLSTVLGDGNKITYSVDDETNFDDITSYDAGEHGFGLRIHSPSYGDLTLEFDNVVKNLFFKLIDFDENETWTIDVYDEFGNIVNLGTEEGIYHLGDYIEYIGSNTISDIYASNAPNANNPENRADDIYSAAYFYFPNINVKKVVFGVSQPGGTIRIVGVQYCDLDTDGDTVADFYDSDSDNDGIPDIVEGGGTDINGDGKVDNFIDSDGDGVSEPYDSDPTKYFITEAGKLLALDFDYDGIINRIDLDSDNDGIVDLIEAGGLDANGNGQIDGFTDSDKDGYHDAFDGAGSLLMTGPDANGDGFPDTYPNKNSDGTLYPNFRDIDSDDDGIPDHTEAQATAATFIDYAIGDTDGDGILDVFDNFIGFGGNGLIPVSSDADGIPDYLDLNSDNHGELDIIEGHDANGDGIVDPSDQGSCLTSITAFTGIKTNLDIDEDGLDDGFDNNISQTAVNYNPTNGGFEPILLPNIDDIATLERDWREPDQEYNVIDFDGFNDYVDFADKHDLTSSFTLETWVKQDATSTGNGMLVSKTDCNKGKNIGYRFGLIANVPTIIWYNDLGNEVVNLTATHAIGKDRWYHLATVYDDASNTVKIYIDGIETGSSNSASISPISTQEPFLIGAKFDDTDLSQKLSNEFKGWIDEVRVWNKALTTEQLRMMMNQEIEQNGTAVKGKVVPVDIPNLLWTDLAGYYPMNSISNGDLIDQSSYTQNGRIRNILTNEDQTAPLPYTTTVNNQNWDTDNTWTHNTVWNVPNSAGVNGTIIDWNIVQTAHNVTINRDVTLLGLIVNNTSDITVTGATNTNGTGTGNMLWLTHYLELDGVLDLDGESQLVQKKYIASQVNESILDQDSGGYLDRDQQGTANSFNYNYWTSTVGQITPSGVGQRGTGTPSTNATFKIGDILKDGRDPSNPRSDITYSTSANGANTGPVSALAPLTISSYWFYQFYGETDDYNSWFPKINQNYALEAGVGYTMKGSLGSKNILSDFQNYVFRGKPYNGDISLRLDKASLLSVEVDRLIGNPYPSAIDANEFIDDNLASRAGTNKFNGALYYWDHFGQVNSHILKEYVGGYATYTKMGGARAKSDDARINANNSFGTKIPKRYIPVGQGFFVTTILNDTLTTIASVTRSDIQFKNSQRIFKKEATGDAVFMKAEKGKETAASKTDEELDLRPKIRLMFDSPIGLHRELLIGVDENTTNNFDIGYDALIIDTDVEDMFWTFNGANFVIQGVPSFDESQEFPLGIKLSQAGLARIKIDALENLDNSTAIYIKDALMGTTKQINNQPFEIALDTGTYVDRFSLVFAPLNTLNVEEEILESGLLVFINNSTNEIQLKNNTQAEVLSVRLYNSLGQLQQVWNQNLQNPNLAFPVNNQATGMYLIQINTSTGTISKKVIIE